MASLLVSPGGALPGAAVPVAALIERVRSLLRDGRPAAARPLLAAIARAAGPSGELAELQAWLLLQEGQAPAALTTLDDAIAAGQDDVVLRMRRAEIRARLGDHAGAAADAAEAVVRDPGLPCAKASLGIALLNLARFDDAAACLREALGAEPQNPVYCQALAQAEESGGAPAQAERTLDAGIAGCPGHLGLRVAAIMLRMRRGDLAGAEALALAARGDGVADAQVLGLLGHARSGLGQHEAAAAAYVEALRLAPEDPYVRHLAAAGGLSADAGRAASEYVTTVFDGYAARFDDHLVSLGYRIPGLIRAELSGAPPADGPLLDLGCGTGLVGVAVSDMPLGPLVGVDLSSAMLGRAAARGLYAELHHADIAGYLQDEQRQFPVVIAADVMPYFGDLVPVCHSVAACLPSGGKFLFSVECLADSDDRPWRLGRLGRYAHSRAHVHAAATAAGLEVRLLRPESVRLEGQVPVPGLLAELRKPAP